MKLSVQQIEDLESVNEGLREIINGAQKEMVALSDSKEAMPAGVAIASYAWFNGLLASAKKANGDFYRRKATVDFMGSVNGIPVAFDCKACALTRLSKDKTPKHQVAELKAAKAAGAVAFLMVAFDSGGIYLADVDWYIGKLADRCSVLKIDFAAAAVEGCEVVKIERGGVPVDFAPAVRALAGRG